MTNEEDNEILSSVNKIIEYIEFWYDKPFPRLRKILERNSLEHYKNPKYFFIKDGEITDNLEKHSDGRDVSEFIYIPELAMVITNIAWHSDLIREFMFDLDLPKLRGIDFNDMAEHGIKNGILGFVSSVSNKIQINKRYLNRQDKDYLAKFLSDDDFYEKGFT